MEVVPGTGHFVFDEAPDATAAQVAAYLQSVE
jgi:pimeloyl-ACP methyl ester carboxylesterase